MKIDASRISFHARITYMKISLYTKHTHTSTCTAHTLIKLKSMYEHEHNKNVARAFKKKEAKKQKTNRKKIVKHSSRIAKVFHHSKAMIKKT